MDLLTFHLGAREFAVDLRRVVEIVTPPPITRVPGMPAALRGVIGLRGEPTAVVDAGVRLAGRKVRLSARSPIVVLTTTRDDRELRFGLLVDAAGRKLSVAELMPWSAGQAEFIGDDACVGFAEVERDLVLVLDVDRLLKLDGVVALDDPEPPALPPRAKQAQLPAGADAASTRSALPAPATTASAPATVQAPTLPASATAPASSTVPTPLAASSPRAPPAAAPAALTRRPRVDAEPSARGERRAAASESPRRVVRPPAAPNAEPHASREVNPPAPPVHAPSQAAAPPPPPPGAAAPPPNSPSRRADPAPAPAAPVVQAVHAAPATRAVLSAPPVSARSEPDDGPAGYGATRIRRQGFPALAWIAGSLAILAALLLLALGGRSTSGDRNRVRDPARPSGPATRSEAAPTEPRRLAEPPPRLAPLDPSPPAQPAPAFDSREASPGATAPPSSVPPAAAPDRRVDPAPPVAAAPAPSPPAPPAPEPPRRSRPPLPEPMIVRPDTPACEIHEVRRGDTLWWISARKLGDPYRWPELFGENRAVIVDPDVIEIHDRIRIPGSCVPPAER